MSYLQEGLDPNARIYVAGHRGMAGSALVRKLHSKGYDRIITRTHKELDLLDQQAVRSFFREVQPDVVFLAAARVGGIQANRESPYEFLYENLQIQNNVIHEAFRSEVRKIVFLGSSCIYPRECPQPMKEEYLLTGPLEPTNEGYALAKIAGLKMLQYLGREYGLNGLSVMPCNLYGPGDSFDPNYSHVIAGLVRRFVEAMETGIPEVTLWGTGKARREFLHVDDMAEAVMLLLEQAKSGNVVNVGSGADIAIGDLANRIRKIVGYNGNIRWDSSMSDGMPRKCLDISHLRELGFSPRIDLESGIAEMVRQYRSLREGRG